MSSITSSLSCAVPGVFIRVCVVFSENPKCVFHMIAQHEYCLCMELQVINVHIVLVTGQVLTHFYHSIKAVSCIIAGLCYYLLSCLDDIKSCYLFACQIDDAATGSTSTLTIMYYLVFFCYWYESFA